MNRACPPSLCLAARPVFGGLVPRTRPPHSQAPSWLTLAGASLSTRATSQQPDTQKRTRMPFIASTSSNTPRGEKGGLVFKSSHFFAFYLWHALYSFVSFFTRKSASGIESSTKRVCSGVGPIAQASRPAFPSHPVVCTCLWTEIERQCINLWRVILRQGTGRVGGRRTQF